MRSALPAARTIPIISEARIYCADGKFYQPLLSDRRFSLIFTWCEMCGLVQATKQVLTEVDEPYRMKILLAQSNAARITHN